MRNKAGLVMAAAAALGACAGHEPARQDIETQIDTQQKAAPARLARAPVTGPISEDNKNGPAEAQLLTLPVE